MAAIPQTKQVEDRETWPLIAPGYSNQGTAEWRDTAAKTVAGIKAEAYVTKKAVKR